MMAIMTTMTTNKQRRLVLPLVGLMTISLLSSYRLTQRVFPSLAVEPIDDNENGSGLATPPVFRRQRRTTITTPATTPTPILTAITTQRHNNSDTTAASTTAAAAATAAERAAAAKIPPAAAAAAAAAATTTTTTARRKSEAAAEAAAIAQSKSKFEKRVRYDDDDDVGIVSEKDPSFFRAFREEIDGLDDRTRCERYGFGYNDDNYNNNSNSTRRQRKQKQKLKRRRIFFGSLVASEPWELFEIVGAEAHGMYDGIVLVESNRTQTFSPRNLTRAASNNKNNKPTAVEKAVAYFFGVDDPNRVSIRFWSNEDPNLIELEREQKQRDDILRGWKELGMRPDDIAVLSDVDETFTRDFLIALKTCDVIPELDYEYHQCHPGKMGLRGLTQIYEGSPECVWESNEWFHPSIFSGHCIEEIGDNANNGKHKPPPRDTTQDFDTRFPGWDTHGWNESNPYTPLANGGDYRSQGAKKQVSIDQRRQEEHYGKKKHYQRFTAFHFHNFFSRMDSLRFKYKTYGHPHHDAYTKKLYKMHDDMNMMTRCAKGEPDDVRYTKHLGGRVIGGFEDLDPFTPVYFRDGDYRARRHDRLREMVLYDETMHAKNNDDDDDVSQEEEENENENEIEENKNGRGSPSKDNDDDDGNDDDDDDDDDDDEVGDNEDEDNEKPEDGEDNEGDNNSGHDGKDDDDNEDKNEEDANQKLSKMLAERAIKTMVLPTNRTH